MFIFTACPTNCNRGTCDALTGDCHPTLGCNPGFYGARCEAGDHYSNILLNMCAINLWKHIITECFCFIIFQWF